jgi:Zn-dependent protease
MVVTTVFEFSKALVSTKFGDSRPKLEGRLTLNPLKHFEPIGFILFLIFGYGWGRPVECSAMNYQLNGKRDIKSRKLCTIIVNAAPMLISIILSILFEILWQVPIFETIGFGYVARAFSIFSNCFAAIAVFNIIPVYPMSGGKILKSLLSPNAALKYSQSEKVIQMVVVFLLLMGWLSIPLNILKSVILLPVALIFGAL